MRPIRMRGWRAATIGSLLLASTGVAVVGGASPAHASLDCTQELTVFARGSGPAADLGLNGAEARKFRSAVSDALSARNISSGWVELGDENNDGHLDSGGYMATGGPGPITTAYHWAIDPTYGASVKSGTDELVALLNMQSAWCPSQIFVVGGYSQGADAVGWALQRQGTGALTQAARDHIAFVALYGDPKFAAGDWGSRLVGIGPWWNRGNNQGYAVASDRNMPGVTVMYATDGILGARKPYVPSEFQGRFGSWCDQGDGFCTGTFAGDFNVGNHGQVYGSKWIPASGNEIVMAAAAKVTNPGAPVPGTPLSTATVNYLADRTILHGSDGSLWVMAGGAKFYFGSMTEFYNLGYSTSGMINVDMTTLNGIPTVPRDGTVLRSGGGQIYVVAGGAKFPVGSMTEYYNQGYVNNQWTNVPQWSLDQIGDAPGNRPKDGTVLRHPNGSLYVVVGGVKFQFGSMTEYANLGYSTGQMIYVSGASTDAIPSASTTSPPRDGIFLRSGGGQIYVMAGGAKFHFGSMGELGGTYLADSWRNVPQGPLDAIGDAPGNMPRNGTVVLRPDGALFVIAGGVRWQFGTMAEFSGEGYSTYTPVAQSPLDGIYDASSAHLPVNETVFQGTGATLWVMKAGVRRSFTSMTQFANMGYSTSQIVRVPDGVLNGLPSGGDLP